MFGVSPAPPVASLTCTDEVCHIPHEGGRCDERGDERGVQRGHKPIRRVICDPPFGRVGLRFGLPETDSVRRDAGEINSTVEGAVKLMEA